MRNENALAGQPIPRFLSPNAQSDEALMKAIATGDQSAMRTLYLRHNANEALPQTDEACFGCGSDRQFMTSSGRTRLR
jgi:hypothetical protein